MIFHWCSAAAWQAAAGEYRDPSLETEGFIHCSYAHQVARTATAVDRGRTDLVLLCIDEIGLPVTAEDCYELGEKYPHIYGPLPVESVLRVLPFPPLPDGSFVLPAGLTE